MVAQSVDGGQQPEKIEFRLLEGATQIATSGVKNVNRGSYTTLTKTLTNPQADSITDYTNLNVQILVNSIQGGEEIRITQVEFEVPDAPTEDGEDGGPGKGKGKKSSKNANAPDKEDKRKGSPGNPGKWGSKGNNFGKPGLGNKLELNFTAGDVADQKNFLPFGQLKKLDLVLGIDLSGSTVDLTVDLDLLEDVPANVPQPPAKKLALFLDIVTSIDLSDASDFQESPTIDILVDRDLDADERFSDGCPVIQIFFFNGDTGSWELVDTADRDPATDVLDGETGEILQCEYIATLPHFSKFSVGGIKKPTSGGGGYAYEIVDTREPSIADYYWEPESPNEGSGITVTAKIIDDVGVKAGYLFYQGSEEEEDSMHSVDMIKSSSEWFTADIPGSDVNRPSISFWVVAQDHAGNSVMTDIVELEVDEALSAPGARASNTNLPAHVLEAIKPKPTEPAEKLEVVSLSNGGEIKSLKDTIIIRNVGDRASDNIRIMLSPEIGKSFRLSDSAISSIEPNGNVAITFEIIGNPNTDMLGNLAPYEGKVTVTAENHRPVFLPVNIGTGDYMELDKNYLNMITSSAVQRYDKIWLINSMLLIQPETQHNYDVRTSDGDTIITGAADELVIRNLSDKELKNIKIISNGGQIFLFEHNLIPYLEPNGQIRIKMISNFDSEKASPKGIRGELLIAPANEEAILIPINIPAERKNSMDEFEASTISERDTITTAVDKITIKNTGERSIDSPRIVLTNDLERIFMLSEVAFKHIEPGEEVVVELKYRAKDLRTFMQDYNGELTIVSEHHNMRNIPISIVWNEISSEHFAVYARSGDESTAKQVVDMLESKYQEVTSRFGEMDANTKAVIYMTSSIDEMKLINLSGHPYYSYSDDTIFVCSCDDPEVNALKMFVHRLIINNYPTYYNMKKFISDEENWLVDGIAGYVAASITDTGMAKRYLDAFISNRVSFQWYGYGSLEQYGASFTFFVFLEDKYGSDVVDRILEYLGHGMISNHRCSTLEECTVLMAVYSASSLDFNDSRYDLDFNTLVEEWISFVDQYDPSKINSFQKTEIAKALAKQSSGLPLTPIESALIHLAKLLRYQL